MRKKIGHPRPSQLHGYGSVAIENGRRLQCEHGDAVVPLVGKLLPQIEDQRGYPNAGLAIAVGFPRGKHNFAGDKILFQMRDKNLAGQNFARGSKSLVKIAWHSAATTYKIKSTLAQQLLLGRQNDKNMKTERVQEINESDFNTRVLNSRKPALVGFVAGWSQACGRFEPVLEEVVRTCNGAAKIFKINVDDNPDLATEYGIQSVPTLIFFSGGAVRVKIVGMVSARAILARLPLCAKGSQHNGKPHENNPPQIGGEI